MDHSLLFVIFRYYLSHFFYSLYDRTEFVKDIYEIIVLYSKVIWNTEYVRITDMMNLVRESKGMKFNREHFSSVKREKFHFYNLQSTFIQITHTT